MSIEEGVNLSYNALKAIVTSGSREFVYSLVADIVIHGFSHGEALKLHEAIETRLNVDKELLKEAEETVRAVLEKELNDPKFVEDVEEVLGEVEREAEEAEEAEGIEEVDYVSINLEDVEVEENEENEENEAEEKAEEETTAPISNNYSWVTPFTAPTNTSEPIQTSKNQENSPPTINPSMVTPFI